MQLTQIDITGARIVGAITDLGHVGPKHHGIVLGQCFLDQKIYVAEHMHTGYQVSTYDDFKSRYANKGKIHLYKNDGKLSNAEVAQNAIKEINQGGKGLYNLLVNNCESFANRAMHGHSVSSQVVTTLGVLAFVGVGVWAIKKVA